MDDLIRMIDDILEERANAREWQELPDPEVPTERDLALEWMARPQERTDERETRRK